MCQEIWREPLKIKQPAFILYVPFALTFTNRLKWEKISRKRINVDGKQWQTWQLTCSDDHATPNSDHESFLFWHGC